ncbi:MAG: DNA gyrase inhibitor YacG [Phenylobacterium sp.]
MTAACALCGKPQHPDYRPFCSKRCADVDLQRWLTGGYAVPAVEDEEGPGEGSPEED